MVGHPRPEELSGFAAGELKDEAIARVEGHLTVCAECRARLSSLPPDRLTRLLGEPPADQRPGGGPITDGAPLHLPRYHVLSRLGGGGMGVVYKAEHRLMKRLDALKVICPRLTANAAAVARFRREVQAVARLQHPNIAAAYDADETDGQLVLIVEYVEGADLARVVREQGPLPVARACGYAQQAALALQHAHERGVLHRDVKPSNLIVTAGGHLKVLDFGLACLRDQQEEEGEAEPSGATAPPAGGTLTDFGQGLGTAEFAAPEQVRDAHAADARSDVYSLGRTLYFLLAGRFDASLPPDAPGPLSAVLARMTAPDPDARFQTMSEVAAALAPFAAEKRRRRKALLLALVLVALLGPLAGWLALRRDGTPRPPTGCIRFASDHDSILVAGRPDSLTEATYEARVLFTEAYGKWGCVFNEWADGTVDNYFWAGPDEINAGFYCDPEVPPAPGDPTVIGHHIIINAVVKVPMSRGTWHHVASVYDGKELRLYWDGVLRAKNARAGTLGRGNSLGFVGAIWRPPENPRKGFVGYLDSLRVSKKARYSGDRFEPPPGKMSTDADTLLLYNFTDPPGSTSITDESGHGRTGHLGLSFEGATCPELVARPR
jgi:serine/threonine protein kinase